MTLRFARASPTTAIAPPLTGLSSNHQNCCIIISCQLLYSCDLSHDIDLIVTQKSAQQDKKWRKRKVQDDKSDSNGGVKQSKIDENLKEPSDNGFSKSSTNLLVKAGGHRAGYDAFMTGEFLLVND